MWTKGQFNPSTQNGTLGEINFSSMISDNKGMKNVTVVILIFLSSACTKHSGGNGRRKPANVGVDSSKYINMLPTQEMRDAALEYARMVGLEKYESVSNIGSQNEGLVAFNWDLIQKNKCFKELVANFYTRVARYGAFYSRNLTPRTNYLFNNLSTSTSNTSAKEGWLWDLALQYSGNDPNLAMTLIGICGHDDTAQLPINQKCTETKDPSSGDVIGEECVDTPLFIPFNSTSQDTEYMGYARETHGNFVTAWQPDTAHGKKLKKTITSDNSLLEIFGDTGKGLLCPINASPMFTQGALGKETLLDESLLSDVASIQAPNQGSSYLPSKYYHVMGAAYATCSLVRNGMPGFMVKKIQTVGINTYRMFRLCGVVMGKAENLKEAAGKSVEDLMKTVNSFRKDPKVCVPNYNTDDNYHTFDWNKPECQALQWIQTVLDDPNIDRNIIENKLTRLLAEVDAAKLFNEKVLKGSECRDVQLTGGNVDRMKAVADSTRSCGDIPSDRCEKAREVIKTWWVDFKWSEAQHIKGADFAINHCKKEDNFFEEGLEKRSCEALKEQPSGGASAQPTGAVR